MVQAEGTGEHRWRAIGYTVGGGDVEDGQGWKVVLDQIGKASSEVRLDWERSGDLV